MSLGAHRPAVAVAVVLAILMISMQAFAASVTVNAATTGAQVGPMHYGIFYEEINHAGDGGLWAEMIRNRSFEDATTADGWTKVAAGGATGSIAIDNDSPLNTYNTRELAVTITNPGTGRYGVYNTGYYALPILTGKTYNCVVYARKADTFTGDLTIQLQDGSGNAAATYTATGLTTSWQKYSFQLTSTRTASSGRLSITSNKAGTFYLTFVSLMPSDAVDGFRPDLFNLLKDLKPGFVRFPGGCYVEGDTLANAWRWKTGLGPQESRRTHWNLWGYWNTNGLGLYEYLLLCENIGAEPLLVINCGMSHGGVVPIDQMGEWVQDALDAIEFANGDATTTWGAKRAEAGHPAPFNLKYMEIGNENGGTEYSDRWALFYDAIKAKYPSVNLIANVWGGYPTNRPPNLVDEHYYSAPDWFSQENHHYDGYSRTGPKVYVGEYACTTDCGQGNLRAGLGEAMFMLGMERNADVVQMASYAPLFVNVNNRAWNPDLIPFNASASYGTPAYYVQKLFSNNRGNVVLSTQSSGPVKLMGQYGGVGVGTWVTQSEYADVVVTNGAATLYQSNFAGGTGGWTVDGGTWAVSSGNLQQTSTNADCRDVYYAPTWTDYTLTLRARKISGDEGFLVMFRVQDHNNWYWWNIGGWANTKTAVERCMGGAKVIPAGASKAHSIQTGVWYNIKIEVAGSHFKCYLKTDADASYTLMHDFTDSPSVPAFDAVATREDSTGDILLKVVNRTSQALPDTPFTLSNTKWPKAKATVTTLTSALDTDENSITTPAKVVPVITQLAGLSLPFTYSLQPYSLTVFRLSMDVQDMPTFADARKLDAGTAVRLTGKCFYYKNGTVGYAEETDRSAGMRLEGVLPATTNRLVDIIGTVKVDALGEKYIDCTNTITGAAAAVAPLAMTCQALSQSLADGLNVRICGAVVPGSVSASSFILSDGSDSGGVKVITAAAPGVTDNSYVMVTGAAGYEGARVVYLTGKSIVAP